MACLSVSPGALSSPGPVECKPMTARPADPSVVNTLVFLYDVDNTLLDYDRLKAEATSRLAAQVGAEWAVRFWQIYEAVREESAVVGVPETLRRFHRSCSDPAIARTAQT